MLKYTKPTVFYSCMNHTTNALFSLFLSYLSFRLLGAALPLLSVSQLEFVLSGDVMKLYGGHVLSAQVCRLHHHHTHSQ